MLRCVRGGSFSQTSALGEVVSSWRDRSPGNRATSKGPVFSSAQPIVW